MKSNMPPEDDTKPDFTQFVDQGIAEGVIGGIIAFMTNNRVNLKPTQKEPGALNKFTSLLLAEYLPGNPDFPYKDSFKAFLIEWIKGDQENINALWGHKELRNLRGYLHVVGGEGVAKFLEERREETLRIIRDIRGE